MTIDDDFLTALGPFDPSWRGLLPTSRDDLARWVAIDDDNAALVDDGDDVRFRPQTFVHRETGDMLTLLALRIEREDARARVELAALPRSTAEESETAERFRSEQTDRRAEWLAALRTTFGLTTLDGKALRDDILIAVEAGDMRPADAERAAELLGWPRFADWADRTRFDPTPLYKWTLPMVAAWIHWHTVNVHDDGGVSGDEIDRASARNELVSMSPDEIARLGLTTQFQEWRQACGVEGALDIAAIKKASRERKFEHVIDKVRRHWPEYLAASTRWIECGNGYVLGKREDRGWSDLPDETSDTKSILYDALLSKKFNAERYCDGGFKTIPSDEWSALHIVGFDEEGGVFRVFAPDQSEYLSVRVPKVDVLRMFPPAVSTDEIPPSQRWKTEMRLMIQAAGDENEYGQERAVDDIRAQCQLKQIPVPRVGEAQEEYKTIYQIVGKGKPGPKGPRKKAS